jgi:hypothetical protein
LSLSGEGRKEDKEKHSYLAEFLHSEWQRSREEPDMKNKAKSPLNFHVWMREGVCDQ